MTEEGTSFSVTDGIQFTTGNGYFFNGVLLYDDNGNLPEEYSEAREVPGFSEDKAWKIVEEELSAIGYEIEGERRSIALPHIFSEEKEYWLSQNGENDGTAYKGEWTEEDDSWYFLCARTYRGFLFILNMYTLIIQILIRPCVFSALEEEQKKYI